MKTFLIVLGVLLAIGWIVFHRLTLRITSDFPVVTNSLKLPQDTNIANLLRAGRATTQQALRVNVVLK